MAEPTEPIVFLNGEYLSLSDAGISLFDLGLVQGASVTEMIRTMAHQPFRLRDHLDRLFRSLKAVGFEPEPSADDLESIVHRVVEQNTQRIPQSHDLGIVVFVTAGWNRTYVGAAGADRARIPTVCVHTFPLPFELWVDKLQKGQHLVTPAIRHIPADCLDPRIKYRSRLHWFLADRQARLVDSEAGALLLDHDGFVTETSSGNFFIVRDGAIITPSPRTTLGGVSQRVVCELAQGLGIPYLAADLQPYDVLNAEESFTSSTPYCLLPVTRLNGAAIGNGKPGPVFKKLARAWKELVHLDIIEQIQKGAAERLKQLSPDSRASDPCRTE